MFWVSRNHIQWKKSPKIFKDATVSLTVAFVKNLTLFSYGIWFLDTQNTFYLMVKGLKNAYLMHFSSLPSRFCCSVCYYLQCSCSLSQRVKQRVKKLFFGQNLFQLMYNHKQKSNAPLRKKHKWADRKGGGSTLTASLTVKYSFLRLPSDSYLIIDYYINCF